MTQLLKNNASGTLLTAATNVATSLVLESGQGALFPAITGSDYFLLTLIGLTSGAETSWEIVKVTARTTDTLTVVRAQESTTAVAWAIGTKVELRLTAGFLQPLSTSSGVNTGDQTIPAASSSTPAALGTAAVGTGTTFARADHVHLLPTLATLGAQAAGSYQAAGTYASGSGSASGTNTGDQTTVSGSSGSVVNTVTGTNSVELVRGNMADNDQFRILVGGTATNAGFVEIATADDGTEPIHVRQYSGVFTTLLRTATLLDGSGNTAFPGVLNVTGQGIFGTTTPARIVADNSNLFQFGDNATIGAGSSVYINSSGQTVSLRPAGTSIATASSTGLAITGALSATGNISTSGAAAWIGASSGASYQPDDGVVGGSIRNGGGFYITTAATERMRITAGGLVGIGTTSPDEQLSVGGNIRLIGNRGIIFQQSTGVAAGSILFRNGAGVTKAAIGSYYNVADEGALEFIGPTGSTNMMLNSSGNLGLGVTPSAWAAAYKVLQLNSNGAGLYSGGYDANLASNLYQDTGSTYKQIGASYKGALYKQFDSTHSWYTTTNVGANTAVVPTQAMTLDASGNLGIGTTSPDARLTVSQTTTAGDIITLKGANSVTGALGIHASVNGGVYLQAAATRDIRLRIGGTDYATLDASGNLSVTGTVSANGLVTSDQGVTRFGSWTSIQENGFYDAGGNFLHNALKTSGVNDTWNYRHTSPAARYKIYQGAHSWYTAPSGTGGTAISFTQAMTLAGGLSIGTTIDPGAGGLNTAGNNTFQFTHGQNLKVGMKAADNAGGSGDCFIYQWVSQPGMDWTGAGIARNMVNTTGLPRVNTGLWGQMMRYEESGQISFTIETPGGSRMYPLTLDTSGNAVFGGGASTKGYNVSSGGAANTANSATFDTDNAGTARFYSRGANTSTVGSYAWHLASSNGTVDSIAMTLSAAGGLSVGTTTDAGAGAILASGNITAYSDIRLKIELQVIPNAVYKIKSLTGYTYTRTDSNQRQTGLIAQDVQKVLPEAVLDGEYLSLAYGNMAGLFVEAIKEQQGIIDSQHERIARLEALVSKLIEA